MFQRAFLIEMLYLSIAVVSQTCLIKHLSVRDLNLFFSHQLLVTCKIGIVVFFRLTAARM